MQIGYIRGSNSFLFQLLIRGFFSTVYMQVLQEWGFSKLTSKKIIEGVLRFSFLFIFHINVKKQNKVTVPVAGSVNSSGTDQCRAFKPPLAGAA